MIELADVISELRAELEHAQMRAKGSALRFEMGPVELEVTVALSREGKAGGKVRFWVAEVNAEGKLSSTSTQKIKLTLNPAVVAGDGTESVYVGGDADDDER
jgi:hypothetical protein